MHAMAIASTHTPDQIARQIGDIQVESVNKSGSVYRLSIRLNPYFERCSLKTVSTSRQMAVMVAIINLSYPSYSVKIYVTITIQNIDISERLCYYLL